MVYLVNPEDDSYTDKKKSPARVGQGSSLSAGQAVETANVFDKLFSGHRGVVRIGIVLKAIRSSLFVKDAVRLIQFVQFRLFGIGRGIAHSGLKPVDFVHQGSLLKIKEESLPIRGKPV